MNERIAKIEESMKARVREEAIAQAMVTTSISIGLFLVPGIGPILSTIYSVLTLPGTMYVKSRTQKLVNETQRRIRHAAHAAEDEVRAKQRAIMESLWDRAVELARSELPSEAIEKNLAGFYGLGIFKRAKNIVRKPVKAVQRLPKEIARAPKAVAQAVTRPDRALRAAARSVERQVRPVYKPLEKPVGAVWKGVVKAGVAITTLPVRMSGHAAILAVRGVAVMTGNKKLADKMADAQRRWDRTVRDRINKRMEKSLRTMEGFVHTARKIGQYTIGIGGLDIIKKKLAEIEREALASIAAQKAETLARLDTPEARNQMLLDLVRAIRGDLEEEYLASLATLKRLYDENRVPYNPPPPDPSFFDILKAGWDELLEILGITPRSPPHNATRLPA